MRNAAPDKGYPSWVRHAGIGLELAGAVAGFALIGYWMGPLRLWERGATLVAGVLMVVPGLVNAAIGVAIMGAVAFAHWRRRRA